MSPSNHESEESDLSGSSADYEAETTDPDQTPSLGDSVFDGTIIGIDPRLGLVTFRQEIDDPRRIKPYRDVKKSLQALDYEESIR